MKVRNKFISNSSSASFVIPLNELTKEQIDLIKNHVTEGYKRGHCNGESGPCLMEQVNIKGVRDIDEQTKLIIDRENWLCPVCTDEIQFKKTDLRKKGIYW